MDLLPAEEDVVEFVKAAKVVLPPLTSPPFSYVAKRAVGPSAPAATDAVRMSKREREVIDLIAEGLSNKEIARRLHSATDTVKSHVHNILQKLAGHSRLQIAAHAHRAGGSKTESP